MVSAILAYNEADRYLDRVIRRCREFSDVLLLDDHSTDHTAQLAHDLGAVVHQRSAPGTMWGQESPARKELWDLAAAMDEWVLICDADQILMGDPRPLTDTWVLNAWGIRLYDAWDSDLQFRADGYWQGYQYHRPWLFAPHRVPEGWEAKWSERGLHCGHAPENFPLVAAPVPDDIYWVHLGWVDPKDRIAKKAKYLAHDGLTEHERLHAESI